MSYDLSAALTLPPPFYLAPLITGSEHLHFGYYNDASDDFQTALDNMMKLNLFFLPPSAKRVLDAGSGLGATTRLLAKRGLDVTSLCPQPELVEYGKRRAAEEDISGTIEWQLTGFESYDTDHKFDFVLFQESFQYLDDLEDAVARLARMPRPGGRVVVGDQFLNEDRPRSVARFHWYDRFHELALSHGLYPRTACDITNGVFPTTQRFMADLERRAQELIDTHKEAKPDIEADIEAAMAGGGLELEGMFGGQLSYRILVYDAPEG